MCCMCVMVHQDKENDIEAAGRKWKIRNSTVFLILSISVDTFFTRISIPKQ